MKLRPGQIATIGSFVYRAKARTDECKGCDLEDLTLCPGVRIRNAEPKINCGVCGIILKRI